MTHDYVVLAVLLGPPVIPLNQCSFLKNGLLLSVRESIKLQAPRYKLFLIGNIRKKLSHRVIYQVWHICVFFHEKGSLCFVIIYMYTQFYFYQGQDLKLYQSSTAPVSSAHQNNSQLNVMLLLTLNSNFLQELPLKEQRLFIE